MDNIEIYTDGGCLGNPGPGGWAFIIRTGDNAPEVRGSGNDHSTTNNKMELTAVIQALQALIDNRLYVPEKTEVTVYTDSQYVKNGIVNWIHSWLRNGWKTAAGKPVKNREYWTELYRLNQQISVDWRWVKGHAGNPLNEACDAMVQEAVKQLSSGNDA